MNRRQKIVQKQFLDNEEAVIKRLNQVYGKSLEDITKRVSELDSSIDALRKAYDSVTDDEIGELAAAFLKKNQHLTPDEARETLQSMIQAKVYQKDYQAALKKQVGGILDTMHKEEFKTVSEYLNKCYEEGFLGTLYDLQGQGVPLAFPLDQKAMVTAVQLDSKISHGLYTRLGEDVALLKKKITAQVSRGISTGMTFKQVAQQLAGYTNIGYNNAIRIARTEGHRIQCQSGMDACYKAQEKGADVVKQWDSTLDARTRDSHAKVDGEIRELDKPFSNGLMFPGDPDGEAAEVINCRCALLQRARWAVGGSFTKMNNFTKQLETFESPESYGDFKKAFFSKENRNYMDYVEEMEDKYGTRNFEKVLGSMTEREYGHYSDLLAKNPMFNKKLLTNSGNSGKIPLKNSGQAKDFQQLETYFDKQYKIAMDQTVKNLDFDAVHQSLNGVDEMLTEFPDVSKRLARITTDNSGVMACGGDEITFNPLYFSDISQIEDLCKRYDGGFWIKNVSPSSIGVHETAHAVEWELVQMNQTYLYDWQRIDAWNKCSEAKAIVSQACKNVKKTPYGKGKKNVDLIGSISRYAHDSPSETMAEAFADVYANGANASPLSVEIKKLTKEQIKKYKGVI